MVIDITFKTPDVVEDAVNEAAGRLVKRRVESGESDGDEATYEHHVEAAKALKQVGRFVRHNEYVTVRFDTTAGTAEVLPR